MRPTLALSEPRRPRLTARPPPARRRGQRRSRPPRGSPPTPAPPPRRGPDRRPEGTPQWGVWFAQTPERWPGNPRSEEHTSELQSRRDLVCRLLLEKKNTFVIQRGS